MTTRAWMAILTLAVLLVAPTFALAANDAAQSAARGKAHLQAGEFDDALSAYALAARAEKDNAEYRQMHMLLRRVIAIRDRLDRMQDTPRWEPMATALHSFYVQNDVLADAEALSKQIYDKKNDGDSAALYANDLIRAGKDADAISLLQGLDDGQLTTHGQILLGIALAHNGQSQAAKTCASSCQLPKDAGPELYYDNARLLVLNGSTADAMKLLVKSFETTPPSRLDAFKDTVKDCPDFTPVKNSDAFATALETKSKIKESDCSGGTSCGKCPSRSSCGSKDKESEEKKSCDDHKK